MVRGVRDRATQAPGYGAFASFAQNPSEAKKLHFISQVTPVLSTGEDRSVGVPADLYYVHWGVCPAAHGPAWMSSGSGLQQDLLQWDATEQRLYRRIGTAAGAGALGLPTGDPFVYPLGVAGAATEYAPKNPDAVQVIVGGRLRFPDNQDMVNTDGYGWGCIGNGSGIQYAGTYDGFAVTRSGTGYWRLYTMDGTTRSSSDSTDADDGNWHDIHVVWAAGSITLYVDNVAVISKTTNLPSRPLTPYIQANGSGTAKRIDIVDWRCSWEGF